MGARVGRGEREGTATHVSKRMSRIAISHLIEYLECLPKLNHKTTELKITSKIQRNRTSNVFAIERFWTIHNLRYE